MECDLCGKPITNKKDLFAGPSTWSHSFSINVLLGRNIRTYHNDCYRKLTPYQKMNNNITPMNGIWGNLYVTALPVLFIAVLLIALITGVNFRNLPIIAPILYLVAILVFEIPLIRLRMKIKREYEDKLN